MKLAKAGYDYGHVVGSIREGPLFAVVNDGDAATATGNQCHAIAKGHSSPQML
jgi:hypothetical protein